MATRRGRWTPRSVRSKSQIASSVTCSIDGRQARMLFSSVKLPTAWPGGESGLVTVKHH